MGKFENHVRGLCGALGWDSTALCGIEHRNPYMSGRASVLGETVVVEALGTIPRSNKAITIRIPFAEGTLDLKIMKN